MIIRPSIIICSVKEPEPGWIDSLAAAGALLYGSGIGLCNYFYGPGTNLADLIPVDICSNAMISCVVAFANKPGCTLLNCSTTHLSPTSWNDVTAHLI